MRNHYALACCAIALVFGHQALAQSEKTIKTKATSVRVKANSAMMFEHKDYWITFVSGPVGNEGIPEIINIGDVITVNNNTIRVNHIFVTEYLVDMEWQGTVLAKEGQISCLAVERPEDVPSDEKRDRLWINVDNCAPLN